MAFINYSDKLMLSEVYVGIEYGIYNKIFNNIENESISIQELKRDYENLLLSNCCEFKIYHDEFSHKMLIVIPYTKECINKTIDIFNIIQSSSIQLLIKNRNKTMHIDLQNEDNNLSIKISKNKLEIKYKIKNNDIRFIDTSFNINEIYGFLR